MYVSISKMNTDSTYALHNFVFFYLAAFKRYYALRLAIAEFFYCSYISYHIISYHISEIYSAPITKRT